MAIQKDQIYLEDAIDIREVKNLTLANQFLKYRRTTKAEIDAFLQSSTAKELADEVVELREYIRGGKDNEHKQLREAYHHIPKPKARKIMNYLGGILEDAVRYSNDRRPGRRKKGSK